MSKFDLLKQAKSNIYAPSEAELPKIFFSSQGISPGGKTLTELSLDLLIPFDKQPFKPYSDVQLEALAKSINENGVLSPILARKHGDKYQIIAGHNRVLASRMLGISAVPAVVEVLNDAQATLALVESNFLARTEFAHSEKARAYKLEYEARKQQGIRSDLTSGHMTRSSQASYALAEISDDSEKQIRRYVQIAELIDPFLELLDTDKLPFIAAYNLSYLPKPMQEIAFPLLCSVKIDIPMSEQIRSFGERLTETALTELLEKPRKPAKLIALKIKYSKIKSYFTQNESPQQITDTILKALDSYFNGGKDD